MPINPQDIKWDDETAAPVVAETAKPALPDSQDVKIDPAKIVWDAPIDASKIQWDDEKNSVTTHLKNFGKNVLKSTSRLAGIGLGAMNSPLAFVWGSQAEQHKDPEQFKKLPPWKQAIAATGAGLKSAYQSIAEKGEWGTLYGDYYKAVRGKTIEEDLPEGLKWSAPTIEFLANVVSDPLIVFGEAGRIAKLKVPKGWKGKIPAEVVSELEKLEKLDQAEKVQIQGKLLDVLRNRKDYMDWWEIKAKEIDMADKAKAYEASKTGPELLKPEALTARSEVPKVLDEMGTVIKSEGKMLPENQGLRPDQAALLRKPYGQTSMAAEKDIATGTPLLKPESRLSKTEIPSIEGLRKKTGLSPLKARSTAGLVLGVEQDDNGDIHYNLGKGLAGTLAVSAGLSIKNLGPRRKFGETLANNPAWSKVHGMIGRESKPFDFSGLWGRINTRIFDRFAPLKEKSLKAYEAARTYNAYKDQAQIKFGELVKSFEKVRNDEVVMTDYIDAHRAYTRAARGLKNPNKVTLNDARQAISEIENHYAASGKNVDDLKDALESFQKWTHDHILKETLDSGLISQAAYNDILKNNKWYATFDVLDRMPPDLNKIPTLTSKEYFSVSNQDIIKKMVGTEKKIADPIEATVRKFAKAQETLARNKVAGAFIDDPAAKGLFRPVATSKKEFAVMKNQGLDPVVQGQWSEKEFGTINRFKDGNLERYVTDIEIADAMKQLTPGQAPRVIQAVNDVFRRSATSLYVPFTISNSARDALMAYTTAPVYKAARPDQFARDWAKGFWEGAKHEFLGSSDLAKEYVQSGGGFGYVGNLRQAEQAKAMMFKKGIVKRSADIIKTPFQLIEKISATIELAPRLGTFNRAKITGVTSEDAALMARQSTIDFNRGGTFTKVANQFIPFLNARVQGRVTVASALKTNPKSTLAKAFVSTVIPGMGAYAWNRLYYSDLYDDIPEYVKQNYFTLIVGKDKDEHGRIVPKYFVFSKGDLGQMTWNPLEFGLDGMWKKDRAGAAKFLVNYLSDLSPVEFSREGRVSASKALGGMTPPIVKGMLEDWANLKFYQGSEIVPYYMGQTQPPELQYTDNTPKSYRWLGKKLNISPLRLQNFAGNILAGYGREGLDPSAMMRGLTGRVMRTKAGERENQAWIAIKDIEQGYTYTRAFAIEMIKNNHRKEAVQLMADWNTGLLKQIKEYNEKFKPHGLEDKGGLSRSYLFTPKKKKGILLPRPDERTGIQQKLSAR